MSIRKREFINNYIVSLRERTRREKKALKYGFDWIIYQLQFQKGETLVRSPFFRSANQIDFKTKTEPEFGIDLSFLNILKNRLTIFVLKDEPLKYNNWIKNNFNSDLSRAIHPDLSGLDVKEVKIILAYNKDEDDRGIQCFENFKKSCNTRIQDNIILTIDRWNLSKIVDEVEANLLSPELFPQDVASLLAYLCAQIKDFDYMSNEWKNQLVPNWKNFLITLFKEGINESKILLVPLALIILNENKKEGPNAEIGRIDLIEWAILHMWSIYRDFKSKKLRNLVFKFWLVFYLGELELYYENNKILFETEHGIKTHRYHISHLTSLNDSILSHDFISKFGIMSIGFYEIYPENKRLDFMKERAEELNRFIIFNPSMLRPLLDNHHVHIFLIWYIFAHSGSFKFIEEWLMSLETNLMIRRIKNTSVPFIEGRNRLELVVEYMITGRKPHGYVEDTSYLLTMILEILSGYKQLNYCNILERYFKHVVLGIGDDGISLIGDDNPIDLQSWVPPDNWDSRIMADKVIDGTSVGTGNYFIDLEKLDELNINIIDFIKKMEEKFPNKIRKDIPIAVYLLACIKNESPLPPFFWRMFLYKDLFEKNAKKDKNDK